MKRIIAPLVGAGILGLAGGVAEAASPAYCALYAKEYAKQATAKSQGSLTPAHVQDRAYYKCLNLDDEPPLPTAYADPDEGGIGGPFVEEGSAGTTGSVPVGEPVIAPVTETATIETDPEPTPAARKNNRRGSGLAVGSAEWKNWCAAHFPNSWDADTGTVIPHDTGKRTACR